jgi:hypothetical protein
MSVSERLAAEQADALRAADADRRLKVGSRTRVPLAEDEMDELQAAPVAPASRGRDDGAPVGHFLENGEERVPFGDAELSMAWPEIPGFRLYWFNDVPGRLLRAKRAGYEHVEDGHGKPVSLVVGKGEKSGGLIAYLMKLPIEWYEDDLRRKNNLEAEKIEQIKAGKLVSAQVENVYVPGQGIKVKVARRG